jgi:hypothetical protein
MNRVSIYALVAALLCSTMMKAQTDKTLAITVAGGPGLDGFLCHLGCPRSLAFGDRGGAR